MPQIDIFGLDRMKVFADLIHDQLGVEVRMRGDKICAEITSDKEGNLKFGRIYLPNLEYADEAEISVLRGFALHEAGHVKYTDPKAIVAIKDYLLLRTQNAFEDQRIEVKLRRDFPGGQEMLAESQNEGYRIKLKGSNESVFGELTYESYFDPETLRKYVILLGKQMSGNNIQMTNEEYKKWVYEDPTITALMDKNGLTEEECYKMGLTLLQGMAQHIGLPTDEASIIKFLSVRMEAPRFLCCWLYVWRGGKDRKIHKQYQEHPYKAILDDIQATMPGRNTTDVVAKAREYLKRLDVKPILPCDYRPGEETQKAVEDAGQARNEARNAASALKRMEKEAEQKVEEQVERSPEAQVLQDAVTETAEQAEEAREHRKDADEAKKKEKQAEENLRRVRDRLAKERRRARELDREAEEAKEQAEQKASEDAEAEEAKEGDEGPEAKGQTIIEQHGNENAEGQPGDGEKPEGDGQPVPQPGQGQGMPQPGQGQQGEGQTGQEGTPVEGDGNAEGGEQLSPEQQRANELAARAQRMRDRVDHDEKLLERREAEVGMSQEDKAKAQASLADANVQLGEARKTEAAAQAAADEGKKIIHQQVAESYKPMIDPLAKDYEAKDAQAKSAEGKRDRMLQVIYDMDKSNTEQIGEGVVEEVTEGVVEKVRNTGLAEDLDAVLIGKGQERDTGENGGEVSTAPVAALSARKYVPFDRAYDSVDRVEDSPKAMTEYEEVRKQYADVIAATTERLRRLWSPDKNKIKVNAEQGRLDPRNAARLGLALKGVPVDVNRIWKTITTRKDPRVAVAMLVDCSGSMCGTKINLAMKAACCLSEVMRALRIPHEIIGHTTDMAASAKLDMDGEDQNNFSRFMPFKGYIFKEFNENQAPTNIFGNFEMSENLDGEAVMWSLKRLERRKEKTKICIVLSDGMPNSSLSSIDELERHLYTVAKLAEAKEKEGMYLYGVGIGEERVKEFYKYASVLNEVSELPKVTLDIVEHILTKMVGTL